MSELMPCQGAHGPGMCLAPSIRSRLHSNEPWHYAHGCFFLVHRALCLCAMHKYHGFESAARLVPHRTMALSLWLFQLAHYASLYAPLCQRGEEVGHTKPYALASSTYRPPTSLFYYFKRSIIFRNETPFLVLLLIFFHIWGVNYKRTLFPICNFKGRQSWSAYFFTHLASFSKLSWVSLNISCRNRANLYIVRLFPPTFCLATSKGSLVSPQFIQKDSSMLLSSFADYSITGQCQANQPNFFMLSSHSA